MQPRRTVFVVLASLLLFVSAGATLAQKTSARVQMDAATFLSMFQWDEISSQWVLKSGMAPPMNVKSREEVLGMQEEFLRTHRYDETKSQFVRIGGKPRNMSSLSREQVERETHMFRMMYRYDEVASKWVSKMGPK